MTTRLMTGRASGATSDGTSRLRVSDSSSTSTPPSTASYRQYAFSLQRNPRSRPAGFARTPAPPSASSTIRVATLRLETRPGPCRANSTSCTVSNTAVTISSRRIRRNTRSRSPLRSSSRHASTSSGVYPCCCGLRRAVRSSGSVMPRTSTAARQ